MASKAAKRAAKKAARVASTLANKKEETKIETPVETKPVETKPAEQKPATKAAEKPAETKPAVKPETKQEQKKEDVKPQSSQSEKQKPAPKQETKKEQKTSKQKKEPEIPTITAEEVDPDIPSAITKPGNLASAVLKNEADGRIDANHSIDLMTSIERRYLSPTVDVPEELRKAMSSQFDAMMWVNLNRWNEQTKQDFGAANLVVNPQIYEKMQQGLAEVFGITLKALPNTSDDKQMTIDFDASNATASKETKEVIKEAVEAKEVTELPKYSQEMSEAECVEALKIIANSHTKMLVPEKLQCMIDFTRKAWKLQDATIEKTLSVMASKLQDPKSFVLSCFSSIAYGGITSHVSPFVTHCTVHEKMHDFGYTEKQIADIVRFFVTLRVTNNCGDDKESIKERLKNITELMAVFDKKNIESIVKCYEKKKEFEVPKVKGWVYDGKEFNVQKVIETVKTTYGNLEKKDLIKKLSEIASFYKQEFKQIED